MKLNPKTTTIIDDGTFRFPVATAHLEHWESQHGNISEGYENFCNEVDHLMPGVIPGSDEMINECSELANAGARVYRA